MAKDIKEKMKKKMDEIVQEHEEVQKGKEVPVEAKTVAEPIKPTSSNPENEIRILKNNLESIKKHRDELSESLSKSNDRWYEKETALNAEISSLKESTKEAIQKMEKAVETEKYAISEAVKAKSEVASLKNSLETLRGDLEFSKNKISSLENEKREMWNKNLDLKKKLGEVTDRLGILTQDPVEEPKEVILTSNLEIPEEECATETSLQPVEVTPEQVPVEVAIPAEEPKENPVPASEN